MIEFFIIGNLGADAVMNETTDKKSIINFAVCHSEQWRNREGNREEKKHWVDCAYFNDSKELLEMLKKGVQVYAKGAPSVKVHVPKGGDPIAVQYLRVSKMEVLSKRRKEETT
jgi:single-strand DNA-binding protein